MTTVDARGLSCPQPVLLSLGGMKKLGKGNIEILVDTDTSKENVSRALEDMIYALQDIRGMIEDEDEDALKATILEARQGFETWWTQRASEDWEKEPGRDIPVKRDILGRLLGGKPVDRKKD